MYNKNYKKGLGMRALKLWRQNSDFERKLGW